MEIFTLIFKLAAGIGLFLFAMYLIEEALKYLSGRNFKLFLQRVTKNRVGAVVRWRREAELRMKESLTELQFED
jgi:phosphate:Na+ symporter